MTDYFITFLTGFIVGGFYSLFSSPPPPLQYHYMVQAPSCPHCPQLHALNLAIKEDLKKRCLSFEILNEDKKEEEDTQDTQDTQD